MYKAQKISNRAFALCYSRQDLVSRDGTVAGAMSLGGVDERLHDGDMVFATAKQGSGFYGVHLRRIYLREGGGGDSAVSTDAGLKVVPLDVSEDTLNRGQIIIDSGTCCARRKYQVSQTLILGSLSLVFSIRYNGYLLFSANRVVFQINLQGVNWARLLERSTFFDG